MPHASHVQPRRRPAGGDGVRSRPTSSAALAASASSALGRPSEAGAGWGFGCGFGVGKGIRLGTRLAVGCRGRRRDRDRSRGDGQGTGRGNGQGTGGRGAKILYWMLPIMLSTHCCPRKYCNASSMLFSRQNLLTRRISWASKRRFCVRYAFIAMVKSQPVMRQNMKQPKAPLLCFPCRQWMRTEGPKRTAMRTILMAFSTRCNHVPPAVCCQPLAIHSHWRTQSGCHA